MLQTFKRRKKEHGFPSEVEVALTVCNPLYSSYMELQKEQCWNNENFCQIHYKKGYYYCMDRYPFHRKWMTLLGSCLKKSVITRHRISPCHILNVFHCLLVSPILILISFLLSLIMPHIPIEGNDSIV